MTKANDESGNSMTGEIPSSTSNKSLRSSFLRVRKNPSSLEDETSSSSLSYNSSWGELSMNGSLKVFHSPLKKDDVKKKRFSLKRTGQHNGQTRGRNGDELELDNGESLSSLKLSTKNLLRLDSLDKSFASDFDESARWVKQYEG